MIRPWGDLTLLEVDPEDRHYPGSRVIWAPDMKTLKFCRRCGVMMEALANTPGCAVEMEFKNRDYNDSIYLSDLQIRHQIVEEEFPVVTEPTRKATVLSVGVRAKQFIGGERVLIAAQAGRFVPGTVYRLVPEDAILGLIEEE